MVLACSLYGVIPFNQETSLGITLLVTKFNHKLGSTDTAKFCIQITLKGRDKKPFRLHDLSLIAGLTVNPRKRGSSGAVDFAALTGGDWDQKPVPPHWTCGFPASSESLTKFPQSPNFINPRSGQMLLIQH